MSRAASWSRTAGDGSARAGTLRLTHGSVSTPAFMPVGTRGVVRGLDATDLAGVGTAMVLANTYHLMLRPGAEIVARLGGLHGFTGWAGPILTDSGGYQVFSLDPRIDEEGATFRSTYDGSSVRLTPEEAVAVQELLGADVAMVLDECIGLPAPVERVRAALERTLRWSERALAVHRRSDQALFGIVQGGVDPDLRAESARRTAGLGFVGFGIGGLSVGESSAERDIALEAVVGELPDHRVRYVMGLGDPEGVLAAIARGADLFDCVWPTRLARHGRVLTADGDFNLRRSEHAVSDLPLDPSCPCHTCATVSRGYLRHLLAVNELTVFRLLSLHNLTYTLGLLDASRRAIIEGCYTSWMSETLARRSSTPEGRSTNGFGIGDAIS